MKIGLSEVAQVFCYLELGLSLIDNNKLQFNFDKLLYNSERSGLFVFKKSTEITTWMYLQWQFQGVYFCFDVWHIYGQSQKAQEDEIYRSGSLTT